MQKDRYRILLNYSFRLLARKAYSCAEIEQRLRKRVKKLNGLSRAGEPKDDSKKAGDAIIDAAAIKKVLDKLIDLKYLDDAKILEHFFEYRLSERPVGKFAFMNEMRKKGISMESAKKEWGKRNIDEGELAAQLIAKKNRLFAGLGSQKRKKKITALLISRGFAPDVIWGILDKVN